jgi:serine/threonine-protein kinase
MGAGSLGTVYRAEQLGSGRKVAIKLFHPDRERDPAAVHRFTREAAILMQLRSAHTVTIYDFGTDPADGALYIAMELSPGKSLATVLADDGPLDWWRVLRILHGLCDSLGEAHALGVVHRDIDPKNVFVEDRASGRDFVKLMDFGLAKALAPSVGMSPAGQTITDLEYNSPEQLVHRPIDARSDLYALGVLGFRLVTGRHPLSGARTVGELVAATINTVPPPASSVRPDLVIPPDVDHLLARLLEKDPDRRFPDTSALGAMLRVAFASRLPETTDTMRDSEFDVDEDAIEDAIVDEPD